MQGFVTALQFLTRIHIMKQEEISPGEFGRSVKFFPLVGAVIGIILFCGFSLAEGRLPGHILASLIIAAEIFITGGLHIDGLMDTADGVFSSRPRDDMLEIMKDSRVGAFGVTAFGLYLLIKFSLLLDLPASITGLALLVMPVIGRLAMVMVITFFPYARQDGMGKAFAGFGGGKTLAVALIITMVIILPAGRLAFFALLTAGLFAILAGRYITGLLGGLTGDVYGAVTELAELVVLAVILAAQNSAWAMP